MPKTPVNYQKTIIYKIVCDDLNITDTYVGSTTNFANRKSSHKKNCTNEKSNNHHLKVYKFIRENGGFSNWSMIEIEKYPCDDVNEATKRERFYYEQLNSSLNTQIPLQSPAEWRIKFKEEIALRRKVYLKKNKEEIALKQKEYNEINKEELAIKKREYYTLNKEDFRERSKEYKEKNKEKIQEKKKETILCDCGENVNKDHKNRHLKTKRHNDLILCKNIVL
jgi:CDGSH-type Zn-finger protein